MKAISIRQFGGPEVLEIVDVAAPKPREDEVVIKVLASSVNPVDWLVRDGGAKSFVKNTFPTILGCDLAGEIVEIGAQAKRFAVGDPVFAMMPHDWGAHAERVALPERLVARKPTGLSMIEAASIPTVAMTALLGLSKGGGVQPGERVLINGASGGVGLSALQIAKAQGATVTAVCGADGFDLVRRLGADDAIDYKASDFTTKDDTYDLVFDCVGNQPYSACNRVLRGRRVHVTTVPGVGTFVRQFFNPFFAVKVFGIVTVGNGEGLEVIKSMVESGKLKTVIDKVYPFRDVAKAQEYSKARRAKGKIVLNFEA